MRSMFKKTKVLARKSPHWLVSTVHTFNFRAKQHQKWRCRVYFRTICGWIALALVGIASSTQAVPLVYDPGILNFSATGQSMWGAGEGVTPATQSYSTTWNASTTLGGIAGSANEIIIPAFAGTPDQEVPYWVPPVVHDHGYWHEHKSHAFHDHDTGFGWHTYYDEYHPKIETHDGYTAYTTIPGLPATDAVYGDTRTGVEAVLSTSGSVGVTSSLGFNGGTVDAAVDFNTQFVVPESLQVGEFFNFSSISSIGDVSLDTQFPKLTGHVSASLSTSISATTTSCIFGAGCEYDGGSLLNIAPTDLDILKINTDELPSDTMSVFGLDDLAFDVTRGRIYTDLVIVPGYAILPVITLPFLQPPQAAGLNLGDVTLDYPDFQTSGNLDGDKIVASGIVDDIVRINADLDAAATLNGALPLQGAVVYFGALTFRGDLLDIDIGPTIDLSQNFELTPTLMIDLAFDHPVMTESGEEITFWHGKASDMPNFALHDEHAVEVTPTYWLSAILFNHTSLDFDLTFSLDVLKGSVTFWGIELTEFTLEDLDFPAFMGSADVYKDTFDFGGFQRITGDSFTMAANAQSYISKIAPDRASSNTVPEPASSLLFLTGLLGLGFRARRP